MRLFILFLLLCSNLVAQRPEADEFKTKKGPLLIQPVLHGTLAIEFNGTMIYVDPYGGKEAFEGIKVPDLILITDIHGDHLNQKTLDALELKEVTIVAPQAVADKISDQLKSKVQVMANGDKRKISEIKITALPMYNLPETADSRHPKGRGNGYVLEMGGKRIYISGDTEDIPEMRSLKNIDIAFVCMNLPYTMDIDQAADAVLAFKPAIVYPYHYRGKPGKSDTSAFQKLVNTKDNHIEVRLRNWYPESN